jgi:hypothetical protein
MENMNVTAMSDEALKQAAIDLYDKIESLPGKFPIKGTEFTWREDRDYHFEDDEIKWKAKLRIFGKDSQNSVDLDADCSVLYYSFHSSSGNSDTEAQEAVDYFETCAALLSPGFRYLISKDYKDKVERLTSLKAEYKTVADERERRRLETEAKRKATVDTEIKERRARLEAVGQVWYDYGYYSHTRYTVKSATEKSIAFDIWNFSESEGRWISEGLTKRIGKHLLGKKPERRYRHRSDREVTVCPVGTADLTGQKPEQPETVSY